MNRAPAPAKINLALVVGPTRADGKHELATVLQRIDLGDRVSIAAAPSLRVTGFAADTLVRDALTALAAVAGVEPRWHATIAKRVPVAAGLGGGSSDAATALRLANDTLATPLSDERPAWKGLVMVPKFSRSPADWLPAMDSARAVASSSRPISLDAAAADAKVPHVAVAWKPVW